jgi:hypothetical protein
MVLVNRPRRKNISFLVYLTIIVILLRLVYLLLTSEGSFDSYYFAISNDPLPPPTNFSGVYPRAFQPWPAGQPLPCFEPGDDWDSYEASPSRTGFLYPKPMKTGGSTASGVFLRMARAIARKEHKRYDICRARFQHGKAYKLFKDRKREKSFLWSILRDPTSRAVSQFFHFHVSREKVEPTDENFISAIYNDEVPTEDYYLEVHDLEGFRPGSSGAREAANRIISDYDFIGIVERMDESVVVTQMLLGLTTGDVLYLDAKTNGGFDAGGYKEQCFFIVPKYISPGMKTYFGSKDFQQWIKWDLALYQAVNRSLDMTIDSLGRRRFEKELARFRWAKDMVATRCGPIARYPCSPSGMYHSPTFVSM